MKENELLVGISTSEVQSEGVESIMKIDLQENSREEKVKIDKVLNPKQSFVILEPISELAKEKGYIIKIPRENFSSPSGSKPSQKDIVFSDDEKAIWETYCIFLIDEIKKDVPFEQALIKLLKGTVKKYGNEMKGNDARVIKILCMSNYSCIEDNLD